MTSSIKVSIIVPVYNTGKYLRKCIESIINQTLKDIEIICVNDGSTDNSLEILEEYAARDKRISVISHENRGNGATRNVGLRQAKGEYIGFVDSDDFIDLTMFEKLYKKAKLYNCDVVMTGIYLYNTNTGEYWLFRDAKIYEAFSNEGSFTAAEHPVLMQYIGTWDRICRREFLNKHSIFMDEVRFYDDVLFTIKVSALAEKISIVHEPLYFYRKFSGNSIVDREAREDAHKFEFLENFRKCKEFLTSKNLYGHFQRDFLKHQFHGINFHSKNLHGFKNYKKFMTILHDYLDQSDYEIAATFDFGRYYKIYLKCLKKSRYITAYLYLKFSRLLTIDNFWIQYRIPKTNKTIKIKRRKFYFYTRLQRQDLIAGELSKINTNLEQIYKRLGVVTQINQGKEHE